MSYTQEDLDGAVDAARSEGAKAEGSRIAGILSCDAFKDRPTAARQIAMSTSMTLEEAITFMAGMPKEAKTGYRTIAERAAEQVECGGDGTSAEAAASESRLASTAHGRSVDQVNRARAGNGFTNSLG